MTTEQYPTSFRVQQQAPPGTEEQLDPEPKFMAPWYKGTNKLAGKTAIITGADSGIGRSVAILFAREGANIAIVYYSEDVDAQKTKELCEKEGAKVILIKGDLKKKAFCNQVVEETRRAFSVDSIDILVNNAGMQRVVEDMKDITEEQLDQTFKTNIYSMFFLTQAALKYMPSGSSIINTTSVTAYKGKPQLLDYSSTKGAITSFTRSLALQLAKQGIRVNCVAPGPIWTPLIVSTFGGEEVKTFGTETPMGRAGQPEEIAPAYVYLASRDSSYMTGQTLHLNGGVIVGS